MLTDFTIAAGHLCTIAITLNKTSQISGEICQRAKDLSPSMKVYEKYLRQGFQARGRHLEKASYWLSFLLLCWNCFFLKGNNFQIVDSFKALGNVREQCAPE